MRANLIELSRLLLGLGAVGHIAYNSRMMTPL